MRHNIIYKIYRGVNSIFDVVFNKEIQEYTREKHGYFPKNGWIAHAKEHYGLSVNKAHNRDGERKWPCPKKHLEEFKEIFEHFGMLP